MPIRLNLLAEQQAAEDLRRRDPVKRAIWVAGLIGGVMLIWSGRLQIKLMGAMSEVNRYESAWKKLEPEYNKVTANFEKAADAETKWAALQALATNRFLWAAPLNAKDSSKRPGDQIFKLQGAINDYPQFKTNLQKAELMVVSAEQADPQNPARRFVTFTLECGYKEKTR